MTDSVGLLWLLLLLEVGVIDVVLHGLGAPTLSQWLWRQHRKHWWSRWLLLGALVVLTCHLVWGWLGGTASPAPVD